MTSILTPIVTMSPSPNMENLPPFITPAILTSVGTTSDGGLRMNFATQELNDTDKIIALKYHKSFGFLAFKPNQYALDELPKEQAEDKNKTVSKRIRAVLFILWQQEGKQGDFEDFYRDRGEKIIEWLKRKLDD